ncbi:transposase [Solibacillus sp. CAU 1738]|uniref:transposase n=1 Tax=Solibacillus sp. CAU 1738 TaxID=3140363 RepID=UPI003260698D
MEKKKVYVSIVHLTCNHYPTVSPSEFMIEIEPYKAKVFEKLFRQINTLETDNMVRAHLPYIPYHYDALNHEIDTRLKKIYALIHEFGDEDTKQFVEQLPYFS